MKLLQNVQKILLIIMRNTVKSTLLIPSLSTATAMKPAPTFSHCRPPEFAMTT